MLVAGRRVVQVVASRRSRWRGKPTCSRHARQPGTGMSRGWAVTPAPLADAHVGRDRALHHPCIRRASGSMRPLCRRGEVLASGSTLVCTPVIPVPVVAPSPRIGMDAAVVPGGAALAGVIAAEARDRYGGGYAGTTGSPPLGSASRSSRRELMSSLVNTFARCHSTVRGLMNSSAPICGFVCPSRAN